MLDKVCTNVICLSELGLFCVEDIIKFILI